MGVYFPGKKNNSLFIFLVIPFLLISMTLISGCDLIKGETEVQKDSGQHAGENVDLDTPEPYKIAPTVEPEFVFVALDNVDQNGVIIPTYQPFVIPVQMTPIVIPNPLPPRVIVPPYHPPPLVPQPLSQPPGLPYHQPVYQPPIYQPPISQPILPPSYYP